MIFCTKDCSNTLVKHIPNLPNPVKKVNGFLSYLSALRDGLGCLLWFRACSFLRFWNDKEGEHLSSRERASNGNFNPYQLASPHAATMWFRLISIHQPKSQTAFFGGVRSKDTVPSLDLLLAAWKIMDTYIFPNGGLMISLLVIYHGTIHGTSPSANPSVTILHPQGTTSYRPTWPWQHRARRRGRFRRSWWLLKWRKWGIKIVHKNT